MEQKEIYEMERSTCLADKSRVYMIERFLANRKLWHTETTNFKLYPRERELCDKLSETNYITVNKSRRMGASSTCLAFAACDLCLADPKEPKTILIICNTEEMLSYDFKKLEGFLMQFPLFLWGDLFTDSGYDLTLPPEKSDIIFQKRNKHWVILKNGCKILLKTPNPSVLCGISGIDWAIFDGTAFIENGELVYLSIVPTVKTGGRITSISTPWETGTLHSIMCMKASYKGTAQWNGYELFEMKWFQDPRYNKSLEWRKGDEKIIDEIDSEGNTKYNPEKWDKLLADGYAPWSPWYDNMRTVLKDNEKSVVCELDASWKVALKEA